MKIINQKIHLSVCELAACGISQKTIYNGVERGAAGWVAEKVAGELWVCVDALKSQYRQCVEDWFGGELMESVLAEQLIEPLLECVEDDVKVVKKYQYGSPAQYLPQEVQEQYLEACKFLHLLSIVTVKSAKSFGFGSKKQFNEAVLRMIKQRGVCLPHSYTKLMAKVRTYKADGAGVVISKKFGNQNTRKIQKGVQQAYLMELLRVHLNWDNVRIANKYNKVSIERGWAKIAVSTVRHYRHKGGFKLANLAGTRGKRNFTNQLGMNNKRKKPTQPLMYVTLDGWTVELMYQKRITRNGKSLVTYDNRQVMVVVLDAFNNYPIGYAIGDRENSGLITEALKNAVIHSKELFGAYYKPIQIQSDNFAKKTLMPVYNALAAKYYTPAEVGNAKAKIIEPYFNSINRTYCQEHLNWSGFNMDARRENQPNKEYLAKVKKEFPTKDINTIQIHAIMQMERDKKRSKYMAAWAKSPTEYKKEMSRQEFLEVFGNVTGYTNRITANGLQPTIGGLTYSFDTFDLNFRHLSHIDWVVRYDESDLSTALAMSEDGRFKFVLERKQEVSMALADGTKAEHEYRKRVRDFNKGLIDGVTEQLVENMELLEAAGIDTAPKLMIPDSSGQVKEYIQDAKGLGVNKQPLPAPKKRKKQPQINTDFDVIDLI